MAKRKKRLPEPEITIQRDRLAWTHRKDLLFLQLPELVSITVDAGENGVHHLQLRPYSDSIEIRDANGHTVSVMLECVPVLLEELPKMLKTILIAEREDS